MVISNPFYEKPIFRSMSFGLKYIFHFILSLPIAMVLPARGKRLIYVGSLYGYLRNIDLTRYDSDKVIEMFEPINRRLNLTVNGSNAMLFPVNQKDRLWRRYGEALCRAMDFDDIEDVIRFIIHYTPFWLRYREDLMEEDTRIILKECIDKFKDGENTNPKRSKNVKYFHRQNL